MILGEFRYGPADEVANALTFTRPFNTEELNAALINALLRIDTLERQVQTLSKDLAKVALSKRKYVSDTNSNED